MRPASGLEAFIATKPADRRPPALPLVPLARIALAASLTLAPSASIAFVDPATGFAVRPQAPFVVTPATRAQFDIAVDVNSRTGRPAPAGASSALCAAGFKSAPQNAHLTQAEINAAAGAPAYHDSVKTGLSPVFAVETIRNVRIGAVLGVETIARPKLGPDAANVRVYQTIHETPKGRVTLVCSTTKKDWDDALLSFRAIRNSIAIPK